jgi:uncharacterized protein (TIGR02271 family)
MTQMTAANEWQGRTIVGSDDERIGRISDIYVDDQTDKPEWATVTRGLFSTSTHFVPLAGASPDGEDVRVAVTKDEVRSSPSIDPDGHLSDQETTQLFEHYGIPKGSRGSDNAEGQSNGSDNAQGRSNRSDNAEGQSNGSPGDEAPASSTGHDISGPTTDDAMTRSEEELRVGTSEQESGRARLRKHVVTEQVTKTVPVQHEEVRVEREPITDANRDHALDGPEISDEEHEVVLHEEQPVVEKRAVPKERVRLGTETVTDEREISEQVRKEQIDATDIKDTNSGD